MKRIRRQPRGIAMVLVLGAVATAGILTYAMLASATMQSQISSGNADRLQRKYLAESGLNLAIYYLKMPLASPVTRVYGAYGNVHYPGESGVVITGMSGTVDTSVTNTANGSFNIVSTATLNGATTTARATLVMRKSKMFTTAANLFGNVTLTSNTVINGGVLTDGTLTKGLAVVNGLVSSLNGLLLGGSNYSGVELSYPMTAFYYMPYYFHDGKRYVAKSLGSTYTGGTLNDTDTVNNPQNVWYAASNITFSGTTNLNGTLVVASGKDLSLGGAVTVTPKTGMPAAILGGRLRVNGGLRSFTSNGFTYLGDSITKGSGSSTLTLTSPVTINGTLVGGEGGWPVDSNGYYGLTTINYDSSRSTISGVSDQMEVITSAQITSWEIDNARP